MGVSVCAPGPALCRRTSDKACGLSFCAGGRLGVDSPAMRYALRRTATRSLALFLGLVVTSGCADQSFGPTIERDAGPGGVRLTVRQVEAKRAQALALAGGSNSAEDLGSAYVLFQELCDAADYDSCGVLADAYDRGTGVEQDRPKAAALLKRACGGGVIQGCTRLATVQIEGRGVQKNIEAGFVLLRGACDGGDPYACARLAVAVERGEIAPGTGAVSDAFILWRDACYDEPRFCDDFANISLSGDANRTDMTEVAGLFAEACEVGEGRGCRAVGQMYRDGVGVPRDADRARNWFERGCGLGERGSCADRRRMAAASTPGPPENVARSGAAVPGEKPGAELGEKSGA